MKTLVNASAYVQPEVFKPEHLVFAATWRCQCGAGMAYVADQERRDLAFWDCSTILLGTAIPSGQPGSVTHDARAPFAFWEAKSERQPGGLTTRPAGLPLFDEGIYFHAVAKRDEVRAKAAYEAYAAVIKDYQGVPLPFWGDLATGLHEAWVAAVKAASMHR